MPLLLSGPGGCTWWLLQLNKLHCARVAEMSGPARYDRGGGAVQAWEHGCGTEDVADDCGARANVGRRGFMEEDESKGETIAAPFYSFVEQLLSATRF